MRVHEKSADWNHPSLVLGNQNRILQTPDYSSLVEVMVASHMPDLSEEVICNIEKFAGKYDRKSAVYHCSFWPGTLSIHGRVVCDALDKNNQSAQWVCEMCKVHPNSNCIEVVKHTQSIWGGGSHTLLMPTKWWNSVIMDCVTNRNEIWEILLYIYSDNLTKEQQNRLTTLICKLLCRTDVNPDILYTLSSDQMNPNMVMSIFRSTIPALVGVDGTHNNPYHAQVTELLGGINLTLPEGFDRAGLIRDASLKEVPIWMMIAFSRLWVMSEIERLDATARQEVFNRVNITTKITPKDMREFAPDIAQLLATYILGRVWVDLPNLLFDIKAVKVKELVLWCTTEGDCNDNTHKWLTQLFSLPEDFDAYLWVLKAMRDRIQLPQIQRVSHDNNVCAADSLEETMAYQLISPITAFEWGLTLEQLLRIALELRLNPYLVARKEEPPNDWCKRLMEILCGSYLKAHNDPVALEDPELLVLQWSPCCCATLSQPSSRGQKRSLGDLECPQCPSGQARALLENTPQCPFCQARALLENTPLRLAILHERLPAKLIVCPVSKEAKSHAVGDCITLVPNDAA